MDTEAAMPVKALKNKRIKRPHSVLKICLGVLLLIFAGLMIAASAIFRFDEWHSLDPSLIKNCERSLLIYDSESNLVCAAGDTKRIWVDIDSLSQTTVNAFIAAEDTRFYSHDGIDLYRIFGAAWADIKAGGYVQGASTISQQLIKLSHLSSEKTLDRKLEEAVLATELEGRFSKDEIMEMYLNYVYFGGGYYGIEAAALGYFGCSASELTAAQAAQLAGILKSPSAYAPHLDKEASIGRRNNVLRLMRDNGFLDGAEYSAALAEESILKNGFPNERTCYIDYAIDEACALLGVDAETLMHSGMSIYTALDSGLDSACRELMRTDECFPSEGSQGALTVVGSDGSIKAMCGCRGEYAAGSLNRAANIERQPGSLIKPILVYAPALESRRYTAATVLSDEPKSFGSYTPRNSDDKYYGAVTLRRAVTGSLNVPAVSVLADVGLPNAVMFAQRMGISFEGEKMGLALALGGFTHGVSPLEMAGAYAAIANGGVYIRPRCIVKVLDANGNTEYERRLYGERVMDEGTAYILTSMLQGVAIEGTGRRLAETGLKLAAKTGTSVDDNGVRDAWCAAYSKEYTAVAWMGTDSAENGSLPDNAVGGNHTALLLAKVFEHIYKGRDCPDFTMPDNVTECIIDCYAVSSGEVYTASELTPAEYTRTEYFIKGTEPQASNGYWDMPTPPTELGWSIGSNGKPIISFTAESRLLTYVVTRRDPGGAETAVAEFSGRSGYLSCEDTTAEPGAIYRYSITAVHPEIKQNGVPLESAPSRELSIVVPYVNTYAGAG